MAIVATERCEAHIRSLSLRSALCCRLIRGVILDLSRTSRVWKRSGPDQTLMKPHFAFSIDTSSHLIRVDMSGFYAPSDVDRFKVGLKAALKELGAKSNQHLMLVDIRQMKVQSQESVKLFRQFFKNKCFRSRRLAIVVASSLSRSQVKRAADGRGAEYFICSSSGEAWLMDESGRVQAATEDSPAVK